VDWLRPDGGSHRQDHGIPTTKIARAGAESA